MVGFNPASAFSMPQASQFSSPRKASSAEEDDLQPINTPTEEPEESVESEPAAQSSKKRHAPLPQHFTPPAKPSGHNWLAYAGIGTVATGVGALGGFGYKTGLPNSNIALKDGWKKLESTKDTKSSLRVSPPDGGYIKHDSITGGVHMISNIRKWQERESTPDGKLIDEVHWLSCEDSANHMEQFYKQSEEVKKAGHLVHPNHPRFKVKDRFLYIPLLEGDEKQLGFIASGFGKASDSADKKGVPAIKPPNKDDGWEMKLANRWSELCTKHDNTNDVFEVMKKEGYEILEHQEPPTCLFLEKATKYGKIENLAKAAVKNEKDWWKLVPREGMGKFIGGGALAGLAVAGAGIGLYEALKPKPKPFQPSPLNRQG
jgi:hypothetical protein